MNFKDQYISKNRVNDKHIVPNPPFPKKLKIDVSNACNYSCVFCPSAIKDIKCGSIDKELCLRIIKDSFNAGARELGISSIGEPLLNLELEEYISYAKKLGYSYIFINTNGFLLNEKRAKSLLSSGIDSVKVSINAATRESYKLVHGADGFERVTDNIKAFSSLKNTCKFLLSFVAINQTINEAQLLKEQFSEYVDEIIIMNANKRGGDVDGRLLPGKDDFSFEYPCGQLFHNAVTTAEGYLLACCQDFDKLTVIADLNKMSIVDAWNSETFINFRRKHINKDFQGTLCNNCLFSKDDKVIPLNESLAHYPVSETKCADVLSRIDKLDKQ